ncbi:glucose 1-dehydrogenase [Chelatococcus asaccharovorans]|uniref:Glucose 1-dehydrogenase n=1 Tax=Chelatococcus asaccharovorans TaxID=28210 RepID=A0A2V3U527_9HYPH|nr:glucose 1-dehydrogenase [Chelatococcus asaccharovorans]MBS7703898.1 SDR family oxidoreductase [Chelatococcus asaccharovorans]PXW58061.1 glucose 1-dehydrogenase [Chelatococcus asaccharovorans]
MTPTSQRLKDRFALITGSSRGIGRAVAVQYAREGATVAINAVSDSQAAEDALAAVHAASAEAGFGTRDHRVVLADVSSSSAVESMITSLVDGWGRLDILVNNAGIQASADSNTVSDEDLQRILGVNLLGAAYCVRSAIHHFLSRPGGGVVINTSSVHQIIPKPTYLAYSMSKGGLANLTRTLALEFADRNVRVNAVAPGAITTDINEAWVDDPQKRADVERHIPMGYAASSEEIAPIFAFLASDEARYITGQTLYACGGLTLFAEFKTNWSS